MRYFPCFRHRALCLLGASLLNCALGANVFAASRPGAPRLLPVDIGAPANASDDEPSLIQPHAGIYRGQPALLFVRQSDGARNLWLATAANPANSGAANATKAKDFEWVGRATRWTARALTQLPAPFSVQNAAFTRDGRILCTINAPATRMVPNVRNKPGKFRLALLKAETGELEFLTAARDDVNSAALSPGGARVAFSAQRSGRLAVFWMSLEGGPQYQIATEARLSGWLNDDTLLYRSTRPGRGGLYRTNPLREEKGAPKAPLSARLLLSDGRDAAISPDGRTICAVVATENRNAPESDGDATQLVFLSADGSGARVLKGTEGATHPAFTPDGSTILFEDAAPAANNDANSEIENPMRTLWAMPMLRVPPVAILTGLRPAANLQNTSAKNEGALAIIGTAYSEESGPLQIKIEVGSGNEPTRWTTVATRDTPAQNENLALWTPPADARGDWTLRLNVRDAAGDWAQTTLSVTLPLFAPLNPGTFAPTPPEIATAPNTAPPVVTLPVAPPIVTKAPVVAPPIVAKIPVAPRTPTVNAKNGSVPLLPIPALPPAPATTNPVLSPRAVYENSQTSAGDNSSDNAATGNNILQPFPPSALRAPEARPGDYAPPPVAVPVAPANPKKTPPRPTKAPTASANSGDNNARPTQAPVAAPAPLVPPVSEGSDQNVGDRARLQLESPPSTVAAGQKIEVEVTLFNTGSAGWKENDARPVRAFYRWINRDRGTRNGWKYEHLSADIAPGAGGKVALSVTAPPSGRYFLSIGLLRLLKNGTNVPPASDTRTQKLWPGEFATNSYEITVTP